LIEPNEALLMLRKWAEEQTLIVCQCKFRDAAFSITGIVSSLTEDKCEVKSRKGEAILQFLFNTPECKFEYVERRAGMSSDKPDDFASKAHLLTFRRDSHLKSSRQKQRRPVTVSLFQSCIHLRLEAIIEGFLQGTIMTFIKRQWEELRPHLKWQLILLAVEGLGINAAIAALVSWATKHIQSWFGVPTLPTHFYVVLAILVFCAILLSIIFIFAFVGLLSKRKTSTIPDAPIKSNFRPVSNNELVARLAAEVVPTPPAQPKPVDLRGEILELYFYTDGIPTVNSQVYILMKMRTVNHGQDEASVTRWGLLIQVGQESPLSAAAMVIPNSWWIRRNAGGLLVRYVKESIDVRLIEVNSTNTYRKGIAREGWVAFEIYNLAYLEFPNAKFTVILVDSFGQRHDIERRPQTYNRLAELMIREDSPVPVPR
jgi:hypothetical protein